MACAYACTSRKNSKIRFSEIASEVIFGPKQPLDRSFNIAITDSQPDKSVQAKPSINVIFHIICQL